MRRTYSEDVRAAAMAALLAGQAVSKVAKEYDIPAGTLKSWKQRMGGPAVATEKKEAIGDLLMDLLEQNVRSLIAISEVTSDHGYLKEQSGAELATLFGVKHDKAIRMIEALNRSSGDAP